jgi:hypothetical protein
MNLDAVLQRASACRHWRQRVEQGRVVRDHRDGLLTASWQATSTFRRCLNPKNAYCREVTLKTHEIINI